MICILIDSETYTHGFEVHLLNILSISVGKEIFILLELKINNIKIKM